MIGPRRVERVVRMQAIAQHISRILLIDNEDLPDATAKPFKYLVPRESA
jgi:hypothetical protein